MRFFLHDYFSSCYKRKCLVKSFAYFKIGWFSQYLRIIEFFIYAGYSSYQIWVYKYFLHVKGNFQRPEIPNCDKVQVIFKKKKIDYSFGGLLRLALPNPMS